MRSFVPWLILTMLVLLSCTLTQRITPVPDATATKAPLPSPTPTMVGEGAPKPTSQPQEKGYVLEFTNQVSSGFATLHTSARTCSGWQGAWEGTFEVDLNYERMYITGTGTLDFSVPEGQLFVQGEAPFSGAGTVSGSSCVILDVSEPLQFEITFSADGSTAEVIMGSKSGGMTTIQCGDNPPITLPIAVAWGPYPLEVPILPYAGCP